MFNISIYAIQINFPPPWFLPPGKGGLLVSSTLSNSFRVQSLGWVHLIIKQIVSSKYNNFPIVIWIESNYSTLMVSDIYIQIEFRGDVENICPLYLWGQSRRNKFTLLPISIQTN